MIKIAIACALAALVRGQSTQSTISPCACPAVYAPVCGVDGKTYSNSCIAGNCGVNPVEIACQGSCPCGDPVDPPKDCCPEGTYCCGDGCVDNNIQFVEACALGTCGCDVSPPLDECCPPETPVCCGSGCITKEMAAISLCLVCSRPNCPKDPSPSPPPPPPKPCCASGYRCCGSRCISERQFIRSSRKGLCTEGDDSCCPIAL